MAPRTFPSRGQDFKPDLVVSASRCPLALNVEHEQQCQHPHRGVRRARSPGCFLGVSLKQVQGGTDLQEENRAWWGRALRDPVTHPSLALSTGAALVAPKGKATTAVVLGFPGRWRQGADACLAALLWCSGASLAPCQEFQTPPALPAGLFWAG